jgi:transcriptional regulator NrdR family protein
MVEFVIKSNGQKEAYQKEKVIRSLRRLNLNQEKIEEVLLEIDRKLPSVVSTKKLFDFIFLP